MEGYRLSPQQRRLWLLRQANPADRYYAQADIEIATDLAVSEVWAALDHVSQRHEVLRTVLRSLPGVDIPLQVIDERPLLARTHHDLSRLGEAGWPEVWEALRADRAREPFDLAAGPLLRADLAALPGGRSRLLLTLPAGCADTVSLHLLVAEVQQYCSTGSVSGAEEDVLQYADAAEWQLDLLMADETAAGRAFWEQRSAEVPVTEPLPYEQSGGEAEFRPAAHPLALGPDLAGAARALARQAEVPLRTVMLTAWQLLFRRIAGEDMPVAVVGANRPHEEMRGAVGVFAQTLPRRAPAAEGRSFSDLLRETELGVRELLGRQEFRDAAAPGGAPVARLAFDWVEPEPVGPDDTWRLVAAAAYAEPFSLRLAGAETGDRLDLSLHYNASLLTGDQVGRLAEMYLHLLTAAVDEPRTDCMRLPLAGPAERQRVLAAATATPAGQAVPPRCVHELFEEQAVRTPTATAVVAEDGMLSYREVDERANRLAHRLRRLEVRPESPVGLLATRSVDFVVGLLGIMKAGGAYLPLDPALPAARRSELLAQAGARVLVAGPADLDGAAGDVAVVDPRSPAVAGEPVDRPGGGARPENLAYAIFTSGSTGVPKAVGVSHGSLAGYVAGVGARLGLPGGSRYAVVSTLAADLGHTVVFPALCSGGTLHVVPLDVAVDPVALAGYFGRFPVDCLKVTPSHLRALLDGGGAAGVLPSGVLVLGGEVSDWELVGRVGGLVPSCRVVNHYGPTETTVGALSFEVGGSVGGAGSVPIGSALGSARVYVLDEWLRPVPVWASGEVFVGGGGVARGYLGRAGLTAERFVADPFGGPGARMYRTGDRARRLADGSLVFLGRVDDQVKVRGFRVEPGEVEGVLRRCAGVREVVVVARADGAGVVRLVAFGVWGAGVGEGELRAHCAGLLPEYMVPSVFVGLERLPLTGNGKVDRRALPEVVFGGASAVFEAARGPVEVALAGVWAGVLGVERVGRDDDFFALGGDSILSIQVVARAARAGLALTPKLMFRFPTIAELAGQLSPGAVPAQVDQGAVSGPVPLTPIQRWFLEAEPSSPHHYNQAMLLRSRGPLDTDGLEEALRVVVTHHDALRLRLLRDGDGGWSLENAGPEALEAPVLTVADLSGLPPQERSAQTQALAERLQTGMDLASGCLLKAACLKLGEDGDRLLLVVHHLAVDGVSWRILLDDLATAYEQAAGGLPVRLPARTTAFRTWAERLATRAESAELLAQLPYWTRTLASVPAAGRLRGEPGRHGEAETAATVLSPEATAQLLRSPGGHSALELLLAALGRAVAEWTGEPDTVIDLESHGRDTDRADVDLSRTVGWFTTLYPLRLTALAEDSPAEVVRRTAERLAELAALPDTGAGFGLLRYGRVGAETAGLRSLPAPALRFNYLGQMSDGGPDGPFELSLESTGPTVDPQGRRPYLVDVTAVVVAGRLRISWSYNPALHRSGEIEELAERCLGELRALATAGPAAVPEHGPADPAFAESGLGEEELGGLLDQLDDLLMGDDEV
ncbi:non-ribosomal peptide synthetase [Streptomyces sp. CB01881]|uniref:non-ribosomal peptide synthetase n=2 Tax=Streptomyces sp. CB01881 TaxID=2078691 RepID=UPI000CDBFDBE|nr:non-ribosomal peptide synthetase [Streptomyces sp. CB01881]AUY52498.1 hypothetical protein C2142_30315 [Streptomyces sp. CB01881]TYC70218.1 amino acid adenylation domain-containing protein [Streptomyces sp. CB01881]